MLYQIHGRVDAIKRLAVERGHRFREYPVQQRRIQEAVRLSARVIFHADFEAIEGPHSWIEANIECPVWRDHYSTRTEALTRAQSKMQQNTVQPDL